MYWISFTGNPRLQSNVVGDAGGVAGIIRIANYNTITEWFVLDSIITKTFGIENPARFSTTIERYEYGVNHQQIVAKQITNSTGEITDHFKYPLDYSSIPELVTGNERGIQMLQQKHIITPVIEKFRTRLSNGSHSVISGEINTFKENPLNPNLVVADEMWRLEFNKPLPLTGTDQFLPSTISTGTFNSDSRYKVEVNSVFDVDGNLLQSKKVNDSPISFQWGYKNSLPVAQAINASNTRTVTEMVPGSNQQMITLGGAPGSPSLTTTKTIKVSQTADVVITLGISGTPTFTTYANYSGSLGTGVMTLTNGMSCGYDKQTFTNVPPGTYVINISLEASESTTSLGACGDISYMGFVPKVDDGIVEFYYEGFEESTSGNANEFSAKAGEKFHAGDFSVNFTLPNSRKYIIEYWYLDASHIWQHITKPYTSDVILSEGTAIDEVRIYPEDASLTTYTYNPANGITSITDTNGNTTYYHYDGLGRLSIVKDSKGNIVKRYDYRYDNRQ